MVAPLRRAMRLQYLVALVDIKPSIIRGCRKSFQVCIDITKKLRNAA